MKSGLPDFSQLLAHRARGFGRDEGSAEAVTSALIAGVRHVEIDVQATKDGMLLAYHDPFVVTDGGSVRIINCTSSTDPVLSNGTRLISRFEDVLRAFASNKRELCLFHVDIKMRGYENKIVQLLRIYKILENVVFVSWIPDVLIKLHSITPNTPLCFSHLVTSNYPGTFQLSRFIYCSVIRPAALMFSSSHLPGIKLSVNQIGVFFHRDGNPLASLLGKMPLLEAHIIPKFLSGPLLSILSQSHGYVCVPRKLVSKELVDGYHKRGIKVAVFNFQNIYQIESINTLANPDLYYIDSSNIFSIIRK